MTKKLSTLLIANRGEIALRVQRTAHQMGLRTVAVFSDADADALFVRRAHVAFRLGGSESKDSYLRIDRILEAAQKTGADAIHPGFGFLAENDLFAQAVLDSGRIFVGPSPAAIRGMGKKREAKVAARALGVPVVPGGTGDDQSDAGIARSAKEIGFPVLLKASAGGGGKGMRVVRSVDELEAAIQGARREAESSFADGTLIVEKYVERPRHVEIQVLGDEHGNVVHLFERECSIQRRHQKIVEESPSVALTPELREKMGADAVRLCKSIGYSSAGTVEFVLGQGKSGLEHYFLEVNTRLQVEHPVTEGVVSGLDLVEEQIRVARGEPLRFTQEDLVKRFSGAAIEVRLCAEDPAQNYLPQSGRVVDFFVPPELLSMPWLRIESGIASGSEVSPYYDSMIAKIIVTGESRADAIVRMQSALAGISVFGITTNRDLLSKVMAHPAYAAGDIDTSFLAREQATLIDVEVDRQSLGKLALAAALFTTAQRSAARTLLPSLPSGFRLSRFAPERTRYALEGALDGEGEVEVGIIDEGRGFFRATVTGAAMHLDRVRLTDLTESAVCLEGSDGLKERYRVVLDGAFSHVQLLGGVGAGQALTVSEVPRFRDLAADAAADGCVAPMPGKIIKVLVEIGDVVKAGQALLVMEAMKMEHTVSAPHDGSISEIRVEAGQQVDGGTLLAIVEEA
jgi:acetyl/propionyl-CoA carboxylase alpha subunit